MVLYLYSQSCISSLLLLKAKAEWWRHKFLVNTKAVMFWCFFLFFVLFQQTIKHFYTSLIIKDRLTLIIKRFYHGWTLMMKPYEVLKESVCQDARHFFAPKSIIVILLSQKKPQCPLGCNVLIQGAWLDQSLRFQLWNVAHPFCQTPGFKI